MQTGRSQARLVVDASIGVKWYLNDEEYAALARDLIDEFVAERIQLIQPSHFRIEVMNAIRNALRRQRLTVEDGRAALADLAALPFQTVPVDDLLAAGFESALKYCCALYDGLYLALAEQAACTLLHADLKLHNTLAGRFPHELWIDDFVRVQ
jgi:predicted nucleic acid-binding protein